MNTGRRITIIVIVHTRFPITPTRLLELYFLFLFNFFPLLLFFLFSFLFFFQTQLTRHANMGPIHSVQPFSFGIVLIIDRLPCFVFVINGIYSRLLYSIM